MQSPLAYSHGSCLLSPISVSTRTISLVVREFDPYCFLAMNKMFWLPYSVISKTWRMKAVILYCMVRAVADEYETMLEWWLAKGKPNKPGDELAPVSCHLSWILHEVTWDWSRGSVMTSQCPTAWALSPTYCIMLWNQSSFLVFICCQIVECNLSSTSCEIFFTLQLIYMLICTVCFFRSGHSQ